jgi:hypothetical protein
MEPENLCVGKQRRGSNKDGWQAGRGRALAVLLTKRRRPSYVQGNRGEQIPKMKRAWETQTLFISLLIMEKIDVH